MAHVPTLKEDGRNVFEGNVWSCVSQLESLVMRLEGVWLLLLFLIFKLLFLRCSGLCGILLLHILPVKVQISFGGISAHG